MVKSLNILGTKYRIHIGVDPAKDENLKNLYGYCSKSDRKIVVVDMNKLSDWDDNSTEAKLKQHNENLRHEILHAFLNESGLQGSCLQYSGSWAMNEEMVDWFAIQYPKIKRVYQMLDCEE